ncbi:hypothetical protein M427DRAFT_319818 [Gonapodya prolifera JEL478]|uniref:Uncharacterized protein n=1 Tax=Gonapodya prolifera (strain JEL478) TaxID=1344416 RepID=A0A139AFR1_GONPJ|nr:hypothetical protein M427DRAFT_319818 [Gonapodya prolifera JEL478]|eukprot:KXS15651.1 hypothetical protein M427DRAFT_319818 [Gonapodya prolifera JEL478]
MQKGGIQRLSMTIARPSVNQSVIENNQPRAESPGAPLFEPNPSSAQTRLPRTAPGLRELRPLSPRPLSQGAFLRPPRVCAKPATPAQTSHFKRHTKAHKGTAPFTEAKMFLKEAWFGPSAGIDALPPTIVPFPMKTQCSVRGCETTAWYPIHESRSTCRIQRGRLATLERYISCVTSQWETAWRLSWQTSSPRLSPVTSRQSC